MSFKRAGGLIAVAGLATGIGGLTAGAKPPPPTLSITASPNPVTFGSPTKVSGHLTAASNVGTRVTLQQAPFPYTQFTDVSRSTTNALGDYAFAGLRPGLNTVYRVKGKGTTSPTKLVFVRIRVTLSVSDSKPARGQKVRFSGAAFPAHNGRTVLLQRRSRSGTFHTVARTTLKPRDAFSSRFGLSRRVFSDGTYRARVSADADHEPGNSRTRSLRVH